jgi:hypothetical protein
MSVPGFVGTMRYPVGHLEGSETQFSWGKYESGEGENMDVWL